ncbi:hypothetical protein C1646_763096 [Rhizophagus diaphanus]|nr:hypothetical protein C1646_763096 [Rhizophagus diaphanus] [Rhizophagus sp. MUCL 43196]
MDHNKKLGNNPIEVKYKAKVEEILDGNHLSLIPKLLKSNLDQNDEFLYFYYQSSLFNIMQFMDTSYIDTSQINYTHTSQIDRTCTSQIDCTCTPQIDSTLQFE